MKNRTRKKMLKFPERYKLHQYLKYACRWVSSLAYKGRLYVVQDDGKVVKSINGTKNSIITNMGEYESEEREDKTDVMFVNVEQ